MVSLNYNLKAKRYLSPHKAIDKWWFADIRVTTATNGENAIFESFVCMIVTGIFLGVNLSFCSWLYASYFVLYFFTQASQINCNANSR